MKISHILKAMIFQFRVDMFLRLNNEKITSDFIMCVCVYSKYIHLQNSSKTNDFLFQISRLFVLLNIKKIWRRCIWWQVRLGYCFTPYQRVWLYNGAPLVAFYDTLGPPWGPGGLSLECAPPYPQRDRKRRLNGAVCRNHRIKRLVPCRC